MASLVVNMTDPLKLLHEYVANGSEAAFREVVVRHADLVYAAALRRVGGDVSLAEEVTDSES